MCISRWSPVPPGMRRSDLGARAETGGAGQVRGNARLGCPGVTGIAVTWVPADMSVTKRPVCIAEPAQQAGFSVLGMSSSSDANQARHVGGPMRWLWSPDGDGRVLPRARRPCPHRDSIAGSACRRRLVYRAPVSKRVVAGHPVVAGGQGFTGTSHEIVVCQTAPELLFCRRASPGRAPSAVRTTVIPEAPGARRRSRLRRTPGGGIAPGSDQAGHGGAGHRQNRPQLRGAAGGRICSMMLSQRSAPVPGTRRRIFPSHPISVTTTLTPTSLLLIHPQVTDGDDHPRRPRAQPRAGGNFQSCAPLGTFLAVHRMARGRSVSRDRPLPGASGRAWIQDTADG